MRATAYAAASDIAALGDCLNLRSRRSVAHEVRLPAPQGWPGVDDEIVFINDREPLHLFPELVERGWSYRAELDSPDAYRMRMMRGAKS